VDGEEDACIILPEFSSQEVQEFLAPNAGRRLSHHTHFSRACFCKYPQFIYTLGTRKARLAVETEKINHNINQFHII